MQKKNKLLLIGWDAADWKIIWPLINKGHMPALKKVIANGVYGNMSTMNPPYSPMLWTSVATGKTPDKHGVLGFVEVLPKGDGVRPVTSNSRKTRAVWNILHNQGFKSNLVGWWPSFPAEPINGVIITDKFQKVSADPTKQTPINKDVIHPWSLKDEFKKLRMFPWEFTKEHILPVVPKASEVDQEKNHGLRTFTKIMGENVSLHNAATKLLRTSEWDFMAVYYDLIDHFCHSFMKFHPPFLPGVDPKYQDIFKDAVVGAYRFQDMMLERKLQLIDDDTTVIILSDHGFESGSKRMLKMPKIQAAAAVEHRQFGMFAAMGPGIKKNQKIFGLGLVDIAPTILNHFNIPVGKDMDGNAILDMYEKPSSPSFIESWDNVEGDFAELDKSKEQEAFDDKETMKQLIELGYVEEQDKDQEVEKAVHKTQCDLKHNLAKVFIAKKDFIQAEKLLNELIDDKQDLDPAPFYFDLVRIYLKTKEYKKAEKQIKNIKESETTIKYNLYFFEAEILAATGRAQQGLKILKEVVQKNSSNAEVWYRVGVLQFQVGDYKDAEISIEKAIELEPDSSKYHLQLAEIFMELKNYEEAVEEALTSIELVKFFPRAHYILGRALEKLGDLENAKLALATAKALKPKSFPQADRAIENIEEKLTFNISFTDKATKNYKKNQITIVSGLPRSGTSLMMQMLDKGGLETLIDKKREADISNPKGYYEYEPVMSIAKDNSWLSKAQDRGVKVVAPLLKHLDPKYRYKVIFMKRDLMEIITSQQKMIGKNTETFPVKLYNAYVRQLETIESWKEREPNVEVIYVDYKELLNNPKDNIEKIANFISVNLDTKNMETAIDKSLYRNRSKEIEKTE